MSGSLFFKECKQILKSIVYLVFIGVILLFYVSQLGDFVGNDLKALENPSAINKQGNPLIKPMPGEKNYGSKKGENPKELMPNAVRNLIFEYKNNAYITYPFFYKKVTLNDSEQLKIKEILYEITGLSPQEIEGKITETNLIPNPNYEEVIPIIVNYDIFKEKMKMIDTLLRGNSSYKENKLKEFSNIPVTYEERLADYEETIQVERITGPYARLFCDYMGIVIGFFSIFVTVAYLMRDKKVQMSELIYSRKIKTVKLIAMRYCALIVMLFLPFILLSLIPLVQLIEYGMKNGLAVDALAFLKYSIFWLLPTVMTTTAVGFLLTILTETPIAIAIQFLWGFLGLNASIDHIEGGNYGLDLIIRHNSTGNFHLIQEQMSALIFNRAFYLVLSFLIMGITVFIYEQKRKGKIDVATRFKKMFGNHKSTTIHPST